MCDIFKLRRYYQPECSHIWDVGPKPWTTNIRLGLINNLAYYCSKGMNTAKNISWCRPKTQGILTEGKGSRTVDLFKLLFIQMFYKTAFLNEEVNCSEPCSLLRAPCPRCLCCKISLLHKWRSGKISWGVCARKAFFQAALSQDFRF